MDLGEDCDDGATNAQGGRCTPECKLARCGDGLVWLGEEDCDDGNDRFNDGCSPSCALPTRVDVTSLSPTVPPPQQDAESAGDLDGDGLAEILSIESGQLVVSSSNGASQRIDVAGAGQSLVLSRGEGRLLGSGGANAVLGVPSASREELVRIYTVGPSSTEEHTIRAPGERAGATLWLDHGMDVSGGGGPDLVVSFSLHWLGQGDGYARGAVALVTDPAADIFEPAGLWLGPEDFGREGSVLRARLVADADGDGRAEILASRTRRGPVWLRDVSLGVPLAEAGPVLGDAGTYIDGNCDLNADGYADVVIAGNLWLDTYSGHRDGFHDSDRFSARVQMIDGPFQGVFDLECIPDVNGDGTSEIAVGMFRDDALPGHAAVLSGPLAGQLTITDAPIAFHEPEGSPLAGTGGRVFGVSGFDASGIVHLGFTSYAYGVFVEPLAE